MATLGRVMVAGGSSRRGLKTSPPDECPVWTDSQTLHHIKKRPRAGVAFGLGRSSRTRRRPRRQIFATGNIRGRTLAGPASAGTARWFPSRTPNSSSSSRLARARRPRPMRAGRPLGLARLTPLRLVLEILVGEEELLACRPDELGAAIHAVQRLVLELHRSPPLAKALGARETPNSRNRPITL